MILGCAIDKDNFIPLLRIFSLEIGLSELSLNETCLDDELLKQILLSLHHSKIQILNLANNGDITASGIKQISMFISTVNHSISTI